MVRYGFLHYTTIWGIWWRTDGDERLLKFLRVLRLLRVLKVLRVLRGLRFFE